MHLNRREFLRLSGVGLGRLLLGKPSRARKTGKAMLYDASKCVGCRACQNACKDWNDLPVESTDAAGIYESPRELSAETWTLIRVAERDRAWSFYKYQCMHCAEASCANVCPTGAAAHRGEFVVIDQTWCIGCGYCVQACPFNVPHRSEITGTARKCTFCFDRVSEGKWPACADRCPTGALVYGQRDEILARAKERVEALKGEGFPQAHLYGEKELGGLGLISILTLPTEAYGLPRLPRVSTSNLIGQWASGVLAAGVVTALPFWLLFKRKETLTAEQGSEEGGK